MAHRIRRNSMEHLRLYDLDKLTLNSQLPPPLPRPLEHRPDTFQRYHFLCDIARHKTDPVYAATPMFRTIPNSHLVKHRRQLFGTRLPKKIVTPISTPSTKSDEPLSPGQDNEEEKEQEDEEEEEESSEEEDQESDDDDDGGGDSGGDDINDSSSSSSSEDDDFGDDDDDRGIVEQLFNRKR